MQLIPREDFLCLLDGQAAGCNEGTIRRKCGFSQGYSQSLPCLGPCRSGCVELESMSWMHARGPQMSGSKCRGAERWRLSVAHAGQSQGRIRLQQSAGSKLAYIALHAENADQAGSETKIEARIRYLCDGQCLLQWKNCERRAASVIAAVLGRVLVACKRVVRVAISLRRLARLGTGNPSPILPTDKLCSFLPLQQQITEWPQGGLLDASFDPSMTLSPRLVVYRGR